MMIPLWAICSIAILWSIAVYVVGRRSAQRMANVREERYLADLDRCIIEARKLLQPSTEASE